MEDWIKVEKRTPDKPEIMILARKCGVSQAEAFAAWFRLYSWADSMTETGFVPFLSAEDGDKIGTISGLMSALASPEIGWVVLHEGGGITFRNFERHNGKSSKKRHVEAERKREARKSGQKADACPQNVPNESGQKTPAIEKEGEREYKENSLSGVKEAAPRPAMRIPKKLDTPEFREAWEAWERHWCEKGRPLTSVQRDEHLRQLAHEESVEKAVETLRHSVQVATRYPKLYQKWPERSPQVAGQGVAAKPLPTQAELAKAGILADEDLEEMKLMEETKYV